MSLAEIDEAPAYLLDWLLAIEDTVNEAEADMMRREAGSMPNGGPPGMRTARINYRELEAEQ